MGSAMAGINLRLRSAPLITNTGVNFQLRHATAIDTPTIMSLRMIRGLAAFEKPPDAIVFTEERLQKDFEQGHFECLLAELPSGETIGFALFYNKCSQRAFQ